MHWPGWPPPAGELLRLLARGASAHQKVGKDGNYTLRNRELHIPADTVNDTVFSLIKQDNKITASEMSERLKLSVSTVRRKIKELRNGGKIVRMGGDKTGYWQISE